MSVQLQIPDAIVQAIRLPEERMAQELLVELAVALYARGLLSLGKAADLAGLGKYEFGRRLAVGDVGHATARAGADRLQARLGDWAKGCKLHASVGVSGEQVGARWCGVEA